MPRRPGPPAVPPPAPVLPEIHRAADHPRHVIADHVRARRWARVQPGAYVVAQDPGLDRHAARRRRALAEVAATASRLRTDHVLSHVSAALLWGLPLYDPPDRVHLIQRWSPCNEVLRDVVRHVMALPDDEVTVRAGRRVTTLERTAVDCATLLGPAGGLVVMDAALHRGADRELCAELVARRPGARGIRSARAVLAAADDGAESPGETLARLSVLRLGVVAPETQVQVETALGVFWADLGWQEWRVVAEYDGVAKYTADGTAVESVLREKRRQEAIEEAGYRVLRLTRDDVARPAALAARLRRHLPPEAFTARVDPYLRDTSAHPR